MVTQNSTYVKKLKQDIIELELLLDNKKAHLEFLEARESASQNKAAAQSTIEQEFGNRELKVAK